MKNNSEQKEAFLNRHIFYGLQNLNDGFDAPGITYFSENHFEEVLTRVQREGLGIAGIEPWKNRAFYGIMVYEDFTHDPTDPNWYRKAFQKFKEQKEDLLYAASYFIPGKLLL